MDRDVYAKLIAKVKELQEYIQGISGASAKRVYPDFSTYSNRTIISNADTEFTFQEDRYLFIDICGTGSSYAIIYQGEVEVVSVSGADEHRYTEFLLKAGTTMKTGTNGTYAINAWKVVEE